MSGARPTSKTTSTTGMTRRQCFKPPRRRSGGAGADHHPRLGAGPGSAVAPSERIVLGAIGIGPRGEFDLNWMLPEKDVQFVAICDARKERREHVKQLVDKKYGNTDCKMYPEMREFLADAPGHRRRC